jgi:hypothetical protein
MRKKGIIEKHQMVAIQNSITGELEHAKVSVYVQKERPKYREDFTIMFQIVTLAVVKKMKPVSTKLLLYLCCSCDYGNLITKGLDQIAEELNYDRRNIERAIKELEQLKIIVKHKNPNDKRENFIYLNPMQSWKGTYDERTKLMEEKFKDSQLSLFQETKNLKPNTDFLNDDAEIG